MPPLSSAPRFVAHVLIKCPVSMERHAFKSHKKSTQEDESQPENLGQFLVSKGAMIQSPGHTTQNISQSVAIPSMLDGFINLTSLEPLCSFSLSRKSIRV